MPTYEFKCEECHKTFVVMQTVSEHDKKSQPKCVHCGSKKVKQLFLGVSVITSKKS